MLTNANHPPATLHVYATFSIRFLKPTEHEDTEEYVNFEVPTNLGVTGYVSLRYAKGEGHVRLFNVPTSEAVLAWLAAPGESLLCFVYPDEFEPTYITICQELNSTARKVVEYVKYFLGRDEIADESTSEIMTFGWSRDSFTAFTPLPNRVFGRLSDRNQFPLTIEAGKELAEGMRKGITPFVAMRHLYRAIQERNPRFKWIDATIAAELAVKEALIRKEPKLAAFIEHVPSPPLTKLYGELLKTYLGEKSPYGKALKNGVEKRNKLVHQPAEIQVTLYEAEDYVNEVMRAIHHLYALLYPDWTVATDLQALRRFYC